MLFPSPDAGDAGDWMPSSATGLWRKSIANAVCSKDSAGSPRGDCEEACLYIEAQGNLKYPAQYLVEGKS